MTAAATRSPVPESAWEDTLAVVYGEVRRWLETSSRREPNLELGFEAALRRLDRPLPQRDLPPAVVIADLARDLTAGSTVTELTRRLSCDVGPAQPAGVAAEWLSTIWSQPAAAVSSALAALERVTGLWILGIFDLPMRSEVSFIADRRAAEQHCLTVALERLRRSADRKEESSRRLAALVAAGRHRPASGPYKDFGSRGVSVAFNEVSTDDQGRMDPESLATALERHNGPVIVCAQAGDPNTGAIDPLAVIAGIVEAANAKRSTKNVWLHIDGGRALWAGTSPRLREQVSGYEQADSWAMDTRVWLDTPHNSGIAVIRDDPELPRILDVPDAGQPPTGADTSSGPGHALAIYATIRQLGHRALIDSVERTCRLARHLADRLAGHDHIEVLNRITLNDVLIRCVNSTGDSTGHTQCLVAAARQSGLHPAAVVWNGEPAIRLTVCSCTARESDIDDAAAALLRIHDYVHNQPAKESEDTLGGLLAQRSSN